MAISEITILVEACQASTQKLTNLLTLIFFFFFFILLHACVFIKLRPFVVLCGNSSTMTCNIFVILIVLF